MIKNTKREEYTEILEQFFEANATANGERERAMLISVVSPRKYSLTVQPHESLKTKRAHEEKSWRCKVNTAFLCNVLCITVENG